MKLITLVYSILFTVNMYAQQYNSWVFGNTNYIRFPGPTNVVNSAMNTSEGCASISDNSGNLLFYTNGVTVWNRNHVVMTNGTGLFGDNSTTQSAIIVRQPGSTTLYWIFTVPESISPNPHCYSIVDMSLSGGLGAVTLKNVMVALSSTEKLIECKHSNGIDSWIITHERNNNTFRAVLLTSAGITQWSTSNAGMVVTNSIGQMKISPNLNRLAVCNYGQNRFCIYNFDNTTGFVSSEIVLSTDVGPYGCEFSPDGRFLYLTFNNGANLYQFDLCNNNQRVTIAASLGNFMGQMQAAPDGKIYIAQRTNNRIHVINNPNNLGAACFFSLNGYLPNGSGMFGLPNNPPNCPIPILLNYTYTLDCGNFNGIPPFINCAFTGYTYEWFVNNNSVSTSSNLNIQLAANTQYTIRLNIYFRCYTYEVVEIVNTDVNGNTTLNSN